MPKALNIIADAVVQSLFKFVQTLHREDFIAVGNLSGGKDGMSLHKRGLSKKYDYLGMVNQYADHKALILRNFFI